MQYSVVLPTRDILEAHPTALSGVASMGLTHGLIIDPCLNSVNAEDADYSPSGVNTYLAELWHEVSSHQESPSMETWLAVTAFYHDYFKRLFQYKIGFVLTIPNGFVHSVHFEGWIGKDTHLVLHYSTYGYTVPEGYS